MERTRTVTWEDPRPAMQAARSLSGLDYLRGIMRGELPGPPIGAVLGMEIDEVEAGRVVFAIDPQEYHYNPNGVVHGGMVATLCDSAMACAVYASLPAGAAATTIEMKVNLTRAMTEATGRVRCEGRVLHVGGRTATAEARVTDAMGQLYAHATTTCLVMRQGQGGDGGAR